jgi:hypothetical protein
MNARSVFRLRRIYAHLDVRAVLQDHPRREPSWQRRRTAINRFEPCGQASGRSDVDSRRTARSPRPAWSASSSRHGAQVRGIRGTRRSARSRHCNSRRWRWLRRSTSRRCCKTVADAAKRDTWYPLQRLHRLTSIGRPTRGRARYVRLRTDRAAFAAHTRGSGGFRSRALHRHQ